MNDLITHVNDAIWGYFLIGALVLCGLWFTWKMKGVQFRMLGEMIRLLTDSATSGTSQFDKKDGRHKHISSFQAFAVSVATRVGTGNLAGVATAIAVGGPGAVFWMWVIALISRLKTNWSAGSNLLFHVFQPFIPGFLTRIEKKHRIIFLFQSNKNEHEFPESSRIICIW